MKRLMSANGGGGRQKMNERARVARFGRQVLAVSAGDHRRNRVRVDREYHEDVAERKHDERSIARKCQ